MGGGGRSAAGTRRAGWICALILCAWIAGCARAGGPAESAPPPGAAPDAESALLDLAEQALAEGRLEQAADHFERALGRDSRSLRARTGLGRVALARGEIEDARRHFAAAAAAHPEASTGYIGLADVAIRDGDPDAARRYLERALEHDRGDARAHARLAALTGTAPRSESRSLEQALALADAHPYDPRALLRAGRGLAASGQHDSATLYLERVLWLADLDPASAVAAARLLPTLNSGWSERRVIAVHLFADERVRAEPSWRFRLRTLCLAVSNSLQDVLATRFVPYSIGEFRSAGRSPELEPIHEAVWSTAHPLPRSGILVAFTGRPPPERPGVWKRGLAEYAGRRATLRLGLETPRAEIHLLAHELLHLYAAIHVAADLESLMNQSGESLVLDPYNLRVVQAMRSRRFGVGGVAGDVLPWIDLGEAREGLAEALSANLSIRQLGLAEAFRSSEFSRLRAAREWQKARQLDPHLGDISRFLAELTLADGRRAEAVMLLEVAAELHGSGTPKGRAARTRAEALRVDLRRDGDAGDPSE